MAIYQNNTKIKKVYYGSTPLKKIFYGNNKIWSNAVKVTYVYNGTTTTSEIEENASVYTGSVNITHSNAFTHVHTDSGHAACSGHTIAYQWAWQVGSDQGYAPNCESEHNGTSGTVTGTLGSTQWCGGYTYYNSSTITDCASNTKHGTLRYKITATDNGIKLEFDSANLTKATISGYKWTYTPTDDSATTVSTTDSVTYQGLGAYTCIVTFYDSNSGSSSSHNFTQAFTINVTDYDG